MKPELQAFSLVPCIGSRPANLDLNPSGLPSSITATVAVYKDGSREVGCTFLKQGLCTKFGSDREDKGRCIHLYPEKSNQHA
jgi:hypothetical protein